MAGNKARYKRDLKKNGDDFGAPAWMTTYSDMVTLLLTFFVLLYSFSAIDLQRFQEVMSAIQHSFLGRTGILSGTMEEIGAEEGQRLDVADYGAGNRTGLRWREQELLEMMAQLEETYEKVRVFTGGRAGEDIALRMENGAL